MRRREPAAMRPKPGYVSKERGCFLCDTVIESGSPVIMIGKSLFLHKQCYYGYAIQPFETWFRDNPPPKMGRPAVPTTDRKQRKNTVSLLYYHRKVGNAERIKELEEAVKGLSYGRLPVKRSSTVL